MWFFALVIVLLIGAVAVVASGRWGSMNEVYDDRPDMMVPSRHPLTSEDIQSSRFAIGVRGYRMDEVDTLLDRLAHEIAERDRRIADLERAAQPPVQRPVQPPVQRPVAEPPPVQPSPVQPSPVQGPPPVQPPVVEAAPAAEAEVSEAEPLGQHRRAVPEDTGEIPVPEQPDEAAAETGWFRVEDENADRPV